MNTDPIADMLTRIRNGYMSKHVSVSMPYSKEKEGIAHVLGAYSFIADVRVDGEGVTKQLIVDLMYGDKGEPAIEKIKRVSKPSVREYQKAKGMGHVRGGFGMQIISTSKGIMSHEDARKENVGGEVLVEVY